MDRWTLPRRWYVRPRSPALENLACRIFVSLSDCLKMIRKNSVSLTMLPVALSALVIMTLAISWPANGQDSKTETGSTKSSTKSSDVEIASADAIAFQERIQPLLQKYCLRCHNADNMKSGIRVDPLTAIPTDRQLFLWKDIQKQVDEGAMPPAEEPQPTEAERQSLSQWITRTMNAARTRNTQKNGSIRRLTVSQYRNTLRDLLGLEEDLTDVLPPDGTSKDGFANNGHLMALSPLQIESYFDIAEKALDLCIVDEKSKPVIQNFRMDFGLSINPQPCPDNLILGANNALLNNADFVVTELRPEKPFEYQPFAMRTAYEFIEGYVGNDTIRAWKKFDSIYHSVFACVRGSPGYPKGEAYQVVPQGLALRPAIPSGEIFGQSNTYGPMANFKISLRELPEQGNFRVTVKAKRYDDGLLLDARSPVQQAADVDSAPEADLSASPTAMVTIDTAGLYQIDVACTPGKAQGLFSLTLGERQFTGQLLEQPPAPNETEPRTAFLLVRLPAGVLNLAAKYGDNSRLRRLVFSQIKPESELAQKFTTFEQRRPSLAVYLGLRRDCGSTLTQVGAPRPVSGGEFQEFVFEGAIKDFPNPDVEKDNVNYLAGIREIGVRSEYTDGRDMPRLLVRSVEFEGPFLTSWLPETHRNIFIESNQRHEFEVYARQVIRAFATRAFRRPVTETELQAFLDVWRNAFTAAEKVSNARGLSDEAAKSEAVENRPDRQAQFQRSVKDALLVVLTSPQFLFLIENSGSPAPEDLDSYELASKLSYFLWNTMPDQRLLDLAAKNVLRDSLDTEVERMIHDPRFGQFIQEFASQWLSLDKFDVVAVDAQRYPRLTRDTKTQLRQEPVQYLRYLIAQNLPVRNLVQSDFILANEVVASYYNLANRTESGFEFVPIKHDNPSLGGVLTQAGILSGLSDGRESNPVKRGAWLARKIIANPPDDPPPNVPQLPEDDGSKLTLREKLERHRNQKGCVKCHSGIDPWGIPFESFDAGGLLKLTPGIDSHSKLPDGTEIKDLNDLKLHLADDQLDQVAFSFMKHAAIYATGRSLSYNDIVFLQEEGIQLRTGDYRLQDLLRFIIKSDLFLKK